MNIILTILALFFKPVSTTYYVSNAGSDSNNGTSTNTSWQTIAKINATSFSAGDQILFKKGDTWNEQLIVSSSGSAGNPITIGSYGTGVKPALNCLATATMVSIGGNLWTSTLSNGVAYQNTIIVNGVIAAKGRYPDVTYLSSLGNAATTQYRLVKTGLTASPNYAGTELVTRGYQYVIDVNKVTSHIVDTLNIQGQFTYAINNYYFFFQNSPSFCNIQNDWAYDSASKLLTVYSTTHTF